MPINSERIVLLTDMKDYLSYSYLAKIYKEEGNKKEEEKLDNICEECKKEDESVSQNLVMHGYKFAIL